MIGETFQIEVQHGRGTKIIEVEVVEYLGNDEYVLQDTENNNRYIRKLTWE